MFLMEPARVHWRVLGESPLHGSDTLGFTDGDCPWNLSLGTLVMGNLMGDIFGWVVDVFSWGAGEGKRNSRARLSRRFRRTTRVPNSPVYVYIIC